MRPSRPVSILSALAGSAGLLAVAACGTTQPAGGDEGTGSEAASSDPVTVTDQVGREVTLEAPAERVVALEWQQVENLLTLGVEPVGVADVEGYTTWNSAEELDASTPDVGTRGEPSIDAVLAQDPDLIIVEGYDKAAADPFADSDVPVLVTTGADAEDAVGHMRETFELVAEVTGRTDEAESVLEEFDAALEDGRTALEDADLETREFVYLDAYLDGSNISIRPFGQGSLMGELGEELGLTNVWKGEVDPLYGLGSTDVEGLTAVGDAMLFYTDTESETWTTALEGNRVWDNLGFVQDDRVYPFPDGIWTFGGPRSSMQVVDAYVDLLT